MNRNPFEEVFRQAVEFKHTEPVNITCNEDSLHTPQVLFSKEEQNLNQENKSSTKKVKTKIIENKQKPKFKQKKILPNNSKKPVIVLSGFSISQPQVISITAFQKGSNSITDEICSRNLEPKQALKDLIAKKSSIKNVTNDNKERQKAASFRYRQKTKNELIELKKKCKTLTFENLMLKNRITELENIVANETTSSSNIQKSVINIEPSTVRFDINIPKILVFQNNQSK